MPPASTARLCWLFLPLLVGHCVHCARPYDPEDERLPGWQVGSQAWLSWLWAPCPASQFCCADQATDRAPEAKLLCGPFSTSGRLA